MNFRLFLEPHLSRLRFILPIIICQLPGFAAEPRPVEIGDLYRTDAVTDAITLADGRGAIYCRSRADSATRTMKQSLWRVDDRGPPRPMEPGEPNAFSPQLSPNGKWILFLSTRPLADGTPAFDPVPPYSAPAADIWLLPVAGGKAIPLSGRSQPYGRVITDDFYAHVAFSADGRRVVFVADDRQDHAANAEWRNRAVVVHPDQGDGYEGYRPMQIWIADLIAAPESVAAARVRRVTHDEFWYADPQWSPDGSFLVVCANRTANQEAVGSSINHNYDLWKIGLKGDRLEQLTTGIGPEFSPRISPDGRRLVCLSSPRQGPHRDVFNLMVVDLSATGAPTRVVFDHHGPGAETPPHLPPNFPLPRDCWRDNQRISFNAFRGLKTVLQCVDLDAGPENIKDVFPVLPRSPLLPRNNPEIANRLKAKDETLRWKSSDGLEIEGVLTLPLPSVAKPPFKLLVLPHGGPHYRASSGAGLVVQVFAANGFAVFQPNFRGSVGYGLKFLDADRFDFGGGDMRDILTGIDQLVSRGLADPQREFVYGSSYGGFMATWLVGHTHQFRAVAALDAVTDLDTMWYLSDIPSWTEWEFGGMPWQVAELMRTHSPLTYASAVRTPTLLISSLNDRRCPIAMNRMFYQALKKIGVDTAMVIYPDEPHGIHQLVHQEDVLRRVLAWFAQHDRPKSN